MSAKVVLDKISKVGESRYMLNDAVIISNIEYKESGVTYDIDFDEDKIDIKKAESTCSAFILESIEMSLQKQNS